MAHGKETPRQKMIGMMYLVLTALLALNVSTTVLEAFQIIDEGLSNTVNNIENKNSEVYGNFDIALNTNQTKVQRWWDIAQEVKKRANDLFNTIEELKIETLRAAGDEKAIVDGKIVHTEITATTDYDTPARIMIGEELTKKSKATVLKNQINELSEFLLDHIDEKDEKIRHTIEHALETHDHKTKDGNELNWEEHNFAHAPLVGFLAIMSGLQINIRNSEAEILNYLYGQIDAGSFKFNKLEATIIPNSSYVIRGTDYSARVFLAASDTTADPTIWVTTSNNPYDSTIDEETGAITYIKRAGLSYDSLRVVAGKGIYTTPSGNLGTKSYGGIIELTGLGGVKLTRPFKSTYQIAEGQVVVSATKMNVFYLGVENPVDISVPGVTPDKIYPTMTNGSISRKPPYIVRPKRPGNAWVIVKADVNGETKEVGKKEFRVKTVPDPVAKIADRKGGMINKNLLLASIGVVAEMENFDFDLKFTVTEFTVSATVQGFVRDSKSNNYKLTSEQKNLIRNLSRSQKIYIENIKAIGPDGSVRPLSTINFILN